MGRPGAGVQMTATVDVEIDGVPVPTGAFIDLLYGAANHDPTVFPIPRASTSSAPSTVASGSRSARDNCLGQQLARLELGRAVNAVLDELPDFGSIPTTRPRTPAGRSMRTPKELRVVFG